MSNKKFIGYGFPGIKPCIDEKTILTKESREKREFAVRKIIPISLLLSKRIKNNDSEQFNVKTNIKYDTKSYYSQSQDNILTNDLDLTMINGPINTILKKKSKVSRKGLKSSLKSTKRSQSKKKHN
jgi:hypothetical protein